MMKVFFNKIKKITVIALTVTVVSAGSALAAPRGPWMQPNNPGQAAQRFYRAPQPKPAPHVAFAPAPAPRRHDGGSGDPAKALAVGAVIGVVIGSLAASSR